jgi:hypothetical protein
MKKGKKMPGQYGTDQVTIRNMKIAKIDKDLIIYTSGGLDRENVAQHERYYVALLNGSITDGAIVVTPTATQFTTHAPLVIIDPNTGTPDYPAIIATPNGFAGTYTWKRESIVFWEGYLEK